MVPKGINLIPDDERHLLVELAQIASATDDKLSMQRLASLIRIRARARYKDNMDSRVLIGVRVPRTKAEIYRAAATGTDRSLYRFVLDALDREAASSMRTAAGDPADGEPGQQNERFVDLGVDVQTKPPLLEPDSTHFDVQTKHLRAFSEPGA